MNLYVDLDTLQLRASGTDSRQVVSIDAKRGDALPLTIRFYQGGSQVRLDATTTINFAIKEDGKYDDDPLVLESSFTASAVGSPDSDPHYTATPSLNTAGLNALFNIDDDSSNDPASVRLMGELTWQATGDTGPTSIKTFVVRMANDVYRGDETTPTTLETPLEWLTARNTERGIQPIRSGASNLFPASLTISGSILDSAGDPISLTTLAVLSIAANGFPIYEGTLGANTFTLSYDGIDTWDFEVDGPDNIFFSVVSDKTDPTGLTLAEESGGHASQTDITITATDGTKAPQLGDRGYITGEDLFYNWTGNKWELENNPFYDVIVVDGDSRSTGDGVGTWPTLLGNIPPFTASTITSVAVASNETTDLINDFTTNVTPLAPASGERGLYVCYAGVNDIFQIGGVNVDNPRDIYDNLVTLWGDARDLGFEVVAFTLQHHSFAAAGITEPEQRQVQLNNLILSDPSKYDFLIPLHQLIPDETTYGIPGAGENYIHSNASGNQFIADNVARILGASDRTRNVPPQAMTKATNAEFRINSILGSQLNLIHEYNLALSTDATATSGTVTDTLGFKRLATTAASGSQAALQFSWPLLNSSNNIAWATQRYRGLVINLDMVSVNSDQILSVSAGNSDLTWNDSSIGFQIQKNGSNYEVRIQVIDGTPTTTTGSWVSMGASTNIKIILFSLAGNATLLWSNSNGATRHQVWQEITTTGAPVGNSTGTGLSRVNAELLAGATPGGTASMDVRSLMVFESDTLPFSRLGY